ncbi:hypothetical protein HY339_00645 [Candidatus Gottesmanbacteria bacterium]|nr:hypothetical protein [Candidatus Gottesmanbacteria bacterium]
MKRIALLMAAASLLSVSQTILYVWQTPSGFVFPLIHNFIEDYYQYLDIMRQGYDGWWTATSRLTPEVYPRMVVSVFLLFLGHIARVLHISLPVVYTGARVVGGIALMTLVYQLAKRTFPSSLPKRIVAFCFVLFGTYFWGWGSDGPVVASLTHAWTELDPIFRWSFVPHHLWSKVGMLAVFLLLLEPRYTLSLILLTLLIGFTNPVIYATIVPTVVLYSIFQREIIRPAFVIIGAGFVLMYHRYLQLSIFPWTSYLLWEKTLTYQVNPYEYAVSLGPTLLLFILAIPAIRRLGRAGSLYLAWAASSWFMLYVAGSFLPITPERFLGGYQFIPLGIGSAVWIFSLKGSHPSRLGVILLLSLYFSVGLYASFREHAGYVTSNKNNVQVYIPDDLMEAMVFLEKSGHAEDVVMAPYEISTMIPAFTGMRVVAGHVMFTFDSGVKRSAIAEYFAARDAQTADRIAQTYRVRWVLAPSSWQPPAGISVINILRLPTYGIFYIPGARTPEI